MIKLNLGSGDHYITGYINVDKYDKTADVQADINNLPYKDNSVDEIVAYQVIEHIPYNESQQVLKEMYRVLKPGGTAIIETPDIDYICRKILEEGLKDVWIFNLVGQYFRPWDEERYEDWEMNAASIHRNPWNFARLKSEAEGVGFKKVHKNTKKYSDYPENLSVTLTKEIL